MMLSLCGVEYMGRNKRHTLPEPLEDDKDAPIDENGVAISRPDWRKPARDPVNMLFLNRTIDCLISNEKSKKDSEVSMSLSSGERFEYYLLMCHAATLHSP